MKVLICLILLASLITSGKALSQTEGLVSLQDAREAASALDQARLEALLNDPQALEAALDDARAKHQAAEQQQAALVEQQQQQMRRAQTLAERQSEQGETLTALLADLTRHSEEVRNELGGNSWLTLEANALPPRLDDIGVLKPEQIETLVDSLARLTQRTGQAVRLERPVADTSGEIAVRDIVRLGDFVAFTDSALLSKRQDSDHLAEVPHTPKNISEVIPAYFQGAKRLFVIDPTQGSVLNALAQQPSLLERFHQGAMWAMSLSLWGLGLLVALLQYGYLSVVSLRMRRQCKALGQPSANNPLGRVLARFKELDKHQAPEALEARLDEAVLAELPRIERGQPIVKLLAAIAPLLGLLGTVTGMIVTFQAITVFGTGDPQLMAGGISQALVTTVLGLVTAVPLLFAQTALATRSRLIIQTLEGEASAALADHLESGSSSPSEALPSNKHGGL
ncbi:MotA/TolQ/ExbB proton channel family protein [Halomonas sp. TBZ9]|uniref:MotA/TolQ/ExbB proton channel family protein n=1 Tax=Vreelandella azerica TaxID=2732867 RepID=A0A7Y3TVL6_9GAMM|nr:MotA/TolQ/ExbB proton channel family protein [Halomonas azerica]NOG30983.1 MotA/TolQ/ExbB proton channel family protein [Halomonas azerica]